jgi:hypothetical protein
MQEAIQAGAVYIREGAILPDALTFESESYSPDWRSVQGLDSYALGRKINDTGWHFFFMAEGSVVTVIGRENQVTVRSAIKRILEGLSLEKNNSVEITQVAFRTFMGVPYANVTFHIRNIQESMLLLGSNAL